MQVDEEAMYSISTCKWYSMRTIYMQVDEEAMYSMRNNLHASG